MCNLIMKWSLFLLLIIGCSTGQSFAVDSCLESDGGVDRLHPGEVRGFEDGALYKFSDFCLYNGSLTEFSCDGTEHIRSIIECDCKRTSFDIGYCE